MNKSVSLIITQIIIVFLLIVTGCKGTTGATKLSPPLQSTSDATSNEYTWHQQYEYELDKNLALEKLLATSNAEIGNVYRDYANKWDKLIEYYYSLLKGYDVYDEYADLQDRKQNMKDYALSSQEEWRLYAEKALDEYEEYLHVLYGSGSALPTDYEKYRLEMYRFRAIQLYELCRDLCIICDSP